MIPLEARLVSRTHRDATTGCWVFTGSLCRGYGAISTGAAGAGTSYGHRVMYELAYGPVPDGHHVHHRCGNRACCNPEHLEAVPGRSHSSGHAIERHVAEHEREAFDRVVDAVREFHRVRSERSAS